MGKRIKSATFTPEQIIGSVYAAFRNGGYGFDKTEIENFVWEIEEDLAGVSAGFEDLAEAAAATNIDKAAQIDKDFITKSSKATATRDLQHLTELGVFNSKGNGRNIHYELTI